MRSANVVCCLVMTGLWVLACATRVRAQAEPWPDALKAALDVLQKTVDEAKAKGVQALYAEIPLMVGRRFIEKEWEDAKLADRREDWAKFLMRSIKFENDTLKGVLAGRKDAREVPLVPDYARLTKKDNYFYLDDKPVLVVTVRNSGGEPGDMRYAAPGELYGIVSGVGASRYDYQNTPIWEVYQNDPKSHRVYDGGWCGHIIKDKWSIGGQGGREGVCIISLDYPPMLEAVRKSIIMKADRFKKSDRFKKAKILSMDWEFTYQNYDESSKLRWQNWLKERYKTVTALNKVWKTDFKGFEDVTLPSVNWGREENPAKHYDFSEFNIWRFNEYLFWARQVIEKECPGWPITVGGGSPFAADFAKSGIDEESMRVRGAIDVFLSETGSRSWGTASVFDLQHSIDPKTMIHDPEYHSTGGYMSLMFFHGASSIDFYNWSSKGVNLSLADGFAMLRGCLDARRLGECIVEFPKATPQAALLYSRASLIQKAPGTTGQGGRETPYTLELQNCYRAGTTLDAPMGFVTSRQVKQGVRKDLKVLVLPCAYFVNEDEVKNIMAYAKSGGTVVVMPTSLVADEYNRRRDYLKPLGIEIAQEIVPKYLAAKARAGVAQPGSEYDFIQGPIAPTVVQDEPTATITWKAAGSAPAKTLAGKGIRQKVKLTGKHDVLAEFDDGSPAVFVTKLDRGEIVYVAMALDGVSTGDLLDWVYDRAGVTRLVRTADPQGKRVPGLESRTVPYQGGYLTYLYNMTEKMVQVKLKPSVRLAGAVNLTLAQPASLNETIELGPYENCILRLAK